MLILGVVAYLIIGTMVTLLLNEYGNRECGESKVRVGFIVLFILIWPLIVTVLLLALAGDVADWIAHKLDGGS